MPVPAVVSAIVSSVVGSVADLPPEQPQSPVFVSAARQFPLGAKKGSLVPPVDRQLTINGVRLSASPGMQIRNQQNLIVMPSSLQEPMVVRYQVDAMGNVWRVWILTAAEVAMADPQP